MSITLSLSLIAVAFCIGHAVGGWREANGKRDKAKPLSESAGQAARTANAAMGIAAEDIRTCQLIAIDDSGKMRVAKSPQRGSTARSESDRDIDRRNRNYLTRDEIHAVKKAGARA